MRFIRAEMRRQGANDLSVPQFRTLGFLNRNPGASLSDLAEHLGITRATASATIERLVRRGLVNRTDDPQERRRLILTLTADGLEHLQQARQATYSSVAGVLSELSEAKLVQVVQGLALLGEAFKEIAVEIEGKSQDS
jgi:DNA-binding MarR family transcriptional regulator